ncbi:hypothetical protein RchiOBHm_Chr4g0405421 [Rosa chinensis]|uniref:Uncharacterized protein n=1 Tax=Rosa chinensis TaxID=74649 RepID=A0A2P6QU24_ROSCH|nr:hypothetical protein RchiOBHm_Chr4g0405421 [Rosa chinensis]
MQMHYEELAILRHLHSDGLYYQEQIVVWGPRVVGYEEKIMEELEGNSYLAADLIQLYIVDRQDWYQ